MTETAKGRPCPATTKAGDPCKGRVYKNGETFCAFDRKKRTASGWDVVANCSNTHDRWSANVRLTINGDQLTWTSERGSVSYHRCQPALGVARSL